MARLSKIVLVWCCVAVLLAVAFAAEENDSAASAPRRILRSAARAWTSRYGPMMWPGTYGGFGGYGWGAWGMPFYQENRWVSASRMDTSNDRRFAMASKK